MPDSNTVVLRAALAQRKAQSDPEMPEADFFELFAAEQVLKSRDLSYPEIDEGLVDGGGDGGIDAVYAFVNGELITEDFDPSPHRQDVTVDLIIMTVKTQASFDATAVDKVRTATRDLLDFGRSIDEVAALYNVELRTAVGSFRTAFAKLADVFPEVRVHYYYATQGDSEAVHPDVRAKAEALRNETAKLLPNPACSFTFLGASELLALARSSPVGTVDVPFTSAISAGTGFVCLVRLPDYYRLITDETGEIKMPLLEANVRDYAGDVEVNRAIRETLATPQGGQGEEFWTLNNGVAIVASEGAITGSVLKLKDPKIVNGLQTSVEVHRHFHANPERLAAESRSLLVRVALTEDVAYRDRVIRATNTQTPIPAASLRATERIHRNIEDYFKTKDLFYERRKNFYKNQKKPKEKIVTIPQLAQGVMAILLAQPDNSRARPSSLLKRDEDYVKVFSEEYPIGVYLTCARMMQRIEGFLRSPQLSVTPDEKTNLKFHLAMRAAHHLLGASTVHAQDLNDLDLSPLDEATLGEIFNQLRAKLTQFAAEHSIQPDQAAKSPGFRQYVLGQ